MDTTNEIPAEIVPLTEEEQVLHAQWAQEFAEREAAEQAAAAAKQSAIAKLAKLGLTEEEAKAVIGL